MRGSRNSRTPPRGGPRAHPRGRPLEGRAEAREESTHRRPLAAGGPRPEDPAHLLPGGAVHGVCSAVRAAALPKPAAVDLRGEASDRRETEESAEGALAAAAAEPRRRAEAAAYSQPAFLPSAHLAPPASFVTGAPRDGPRPPSMMRATPPTSTPPTSPSEERALQLQRPATRQGTGEARRGGGVGAVGRRRGAAEEIREEDRWDASRTQRRLTHTASSRTAWTRGAASHLITPRNLSSMCRCRRTRREETAAGSAVEAARGQGEIAPPPPPLLTITTHHRAPPPTALHRWPTTPEELTQAISRARRAPASTSHRPPTFCRRCRASRTR